MTKDYEPHELTPREKALILALNEYFSTYAQPHGAKQVTFNPKTGEAVLLIPGENHLGHSRQGKSIFALSQELRDEDERLDGLLLGQDL